MQYKLLIILCLVSVRAEEFFNTTPQPINTNFSCAGRKLGFFADVEANCRIYHTCDDHGNKFTYHCPEETAFRQDALICDYAHLVDCTKGVRVGKTPLVDNAKLTYRNPYTSTQQFPKVFNTTQKQFTFSTTPKTTQGKPQNQGTTKSFQSFRSNQVVTQVTKPFFNFQGDDKGSGNTKSSGKSQYGEGRPQTTQSLFQRNDSKTMSTNLFPDFQNAFAKPSSDHPSIYGKLSGQRDRNSESTTSRFKNYTPKESTRASLSFPNSNYPYSETLRSIQNNSRLPSTTPSTTGRPADSYTGSLKPLKPNELEYDPYYPRNPSTTEAYYTPIVSNNSPRTSQFSTQQPFVGVQFEIPDVLPDFNSLEDLVERRKLFYIPRIVTI